MAVVILFLFTVVNISCFTNDNKAKNRNTKINDAINKANSSRIISKNRTNELNVSHSTEKAGDLNDYWITLKVKNNSNKDMNFADFKIYVINDQTLKQLYKKNVFSFGDLNSLAIKRNKKKESIKLATGHYIIPTSDDKKYYKSEATNWLKKINRKLKKGETFELKFASDMLSFDLRRKTLEFVVEYNDQIYKQKISFR